jgi:hypothetical protein
MRKLCCWSFAAMVGLMLTGCAQQKPAVDPAAAVTELRTGAPLLRCRADCVADWRRAQPRAAQLEAAGRWSELAALVITVNYQDDLTLYYLARAAEELGYPAAAASYYRQSTYISGTSLSCRYESGVCGGVVLPDVALARIEATESEAERSRPHRPRHPGAKPATESKSAPAGRKQRPLAAPEREPQLPEGAEPVPVPLSPAAPAPEQPQPMVSEQPNIGPEPGAPSQPEAPPPARMDPVAKQYIEPPAAR